MSTRTSNMAHTRAMIQGEMDQTRRLPAEILEFVFMHLKLSDPNSDAGFDAEWIKVTWVCGRWRQIALQCSALWAVTAVMERPGASSDPFDAARTLLERASPRPLTLVAVTPPALQVLRPHAHRVRSLTHGTPSDTRLQNFLASHFTRTPFRICGSWKLKT
ncbi:hypothetical protein C8Q70DRAFT_991045 [Cubamyces menziesii]|nr:hypothetical protein C8Q70DRAFT_991045 [Cubamyces menziesii]